MTRPTVGGGPKKVLYALKTATQTGLRSTAKALNSKNTCKACGLGMGGQQGGMTNELGEYPSVCNKSIQAQSTDIQPAIPESVLAHSLAAGAENRDFIDRYTSGFADFQADIDGESWPAIEARCGIPRADIERVAALYAKANNAVFAWGMGMTHHLHGVDNVEYIANLALLRGQIGRPGAGLLPLRGHSNVQGIGTIGVKPVLSAEIFARIEQAFGVSLSSIAGHDTMAGMQAASCGEIDAAVIMGGNLYEASPNQPWAEQALNRISFKLFLTTTLNRGHVAGCDTGEVLVLPVTARDEEWEPTTQESMFNYVRLSDGGITRLDTVRPEVDILTRLAERLQAAPGKLRSRRR